MRLMPETEAYPVFKNLSSFFNLVRRKEQAPPAGPSYRVSFPAYTSR